MLSINGDSWAGLTAPRVKAKLSRVVWNRWRWKPTKLQLFRDGIGACPVGTGGNDVVAESRALSGTVSEAMMLSWWQDLRRGLTWWI